MRAAGDKGPGIWRVTDFNQYSTTVIMEKRECRAYPLKLGVLELERQAVDWQITSMLEA